VERDGITGVLRGDDRAGPLLRWKGHGVNWQADASRRKGFNDRVR